MQSDQSDIPRKRARLDNGPAPQQHHAPLKLQPLLNAADTSKDGARLTISADNLPQATSLTQFNNLQLQALKSLLQQYKAEHEALLHGLKSQFNTFCAEMQSTDTTAVSQQTANQQAATQQQEQEQEQADLETQQPEAREDENKDVAKDDQPSGLDNNQTHPPSSPQRQTPIPTNSMTSHEGGAAASLSFWASAPPSVSKTPQSKAAKPAETEAVSSELAASVQPGPATKDVVTVSGTPSDAAGEKTGQQAGAAATQDNNTDMQVDTQPAEAQPVSEVPTTVTVDAEPTNTQQTEHPAPDNSKDTDMVEQPSQVDEPVVAAPQQEQNQAAVQEIAGTQDVESQPEAEQPDLTIYEALTYAKLNARLEKTLDSHSTARQQVVNMPQDTDSKHVQARARFDGTSIEQLLLLEVQASATTEQELDDCGALACLVGSKGRHLIKHNAVLIGRSTEAKGEVDIEVCEEQGPHSNKISRRQAFLTLAADGSWHITNTGRQTLIVDGVVCEQFQSTTLPHLGLLEVADVRLLFMQNLAATQRLLRRSARVAV